MQSPVLTTSKSPIPAKTGADGFVPAVRICKRVNEIKNWDFQKKSSNECNLALPPPRNTKVRAASWSISFKGVHTCSTHVHMYIIVSSLLLSHWLVKPCPPYQVTLICRPSLLQWACLASSNGPHSERIPPVVILKFPIHTHKVGSDIMNRVEPFSSVVVSVIVQPPTNHWRLWAQAGLIIWQGGPASVGGKMSTFVVTFYSCYQRLSFLTCYDSSLHLGRTKPTAYSFSPEHILHVILGQFNIDWNIFMCHVIVY